MQDVDLAIQIDLDPGQALDERAGNPLAGRLGGDVLSDPL